MNKITNNNSDTVYINNQTNNTRNENQFMINIIFFISHKNKWQKNNSQRSR